MIEIQNSIDILYNTIIIGIFAGLTYNLKNIEKELNILRELYIVALLLAVKLVFKTILNVFEVFKLEKNSKT